MNRLMPAILIAVSAFFLILLCFTNPPTAVGFGGDSFGNGKATPTPTPAPATAAAPTPTPPALPISASGVVNTNNQRCIDRGGYVAESTNCVTKDINYRWYYGGTGLNIGEKVNGGVLDQPKTLQPVIATPTPTPAPKAGRKLPFTMYNDTTVMTCVNNKEQVVSSDSCDEKDKHWYYYPLRQGGKLYDLGEKVSGGTSKKPPESGSEPPASPTPLPTSDPDPVEKTSGDGVDYEFTRLTSDNQVRACVDQNMAVINTVNCRHKYLPSSEAPAMTIGAAFWYYYIPKNGKTFTAGEKVAGGSFDPTDPIAIGTVDSGPEPAVPPSQATPTPAPTEEPKLALAEDNNSKLRPLTPDDIELVGKYAAVAAKPLEEMTPKVWQAAVRHQYALACSKPVWPLALAGIAFWWVFFIKSRWHIHDGFEEWERWGYLTCVYIAPSLVTMVFGVIGLVRLSTSIARLIAPEYYAIQDFIITLVK